MKILVDAFIEKNFGDDLFLKIVFERYSETIEWYVITDSEEKLDAFKAYKNVYLYNRKKHNIWNFDGVLNIGGSIFMQNGKRWIRQLVSRLRYALPMKLKGKPVYILGCNYGPSNSNLMYKTNKLYIKHFVKDICFRDKESYGLFKTIKQARVASDIVYSLKCNHQNINEDKKIGISIMNFDDQQVNKDLVNKLVDISNHYISKGYSIDYLAFCENQNDVETYRAIEQKISDTSKKNINLNIYQGNIDNYLNSMQNLQYIITLRFHSLILAQVLGKNYYPIVYSKKTTNILIDQEYKGQFTKVEDIAQLKLSDVVAKLEKNKIPIKQSIVDQANSHFEKLDEYIGEFSS
ncbi:polysaccharide pyruvyl transferase family protein [Niallia taxi]|uniref:Polysaccharide pyruvyl transferase family protein n=1 Tax=Niallia taxi TaxID=2499688 RepID=A0A437KCQ3_9BACI|nr:polysaccharide pyruvyl transferase family protein [Niallia taxi]RVT63843.1 polysaccharide pyruvyl transferase family protein [Niallia taxi]